MSELILPDRLKQETIIPFQFINKIPEQILRQICWALATATTNENGPEADKALIQLMMEVDMAGKAINAEQEAKKREKKERKAKKAARRN